MDFSHAKVTFHIFDTETSTRYNCNYQMPINVISSILIQPMIQPM